MREAGDKGASRWWKRRLLNDRGMGSDKAFKGGWEESKWWWACRNCV